MTQGQKSGMVVLGESMDEKAGSPNLSEIST